MHRYIVHLINDYIHLCIIKIKVICGCKNLLSFPNINDTNVPQIAPIAVTNWHFMACKREQNYLVNLKIIK